MPALLLTLLLLFSTTPLIAAPPDMFSFAESLAAEKDHYRAITEYKRFLHFYPQDTRVPAALLGVATSLLAGERWEQADAVLEKIWQQHPDRPEAQQARQLSADAAFARKDYPLARERYQRLKEALPAASQKANIQITRCLLEEKQLQKAEQSLAELPESEASELQIFLHDYRQLPRKSPILAGTLSAILPGAGQLYTERPKQAGVAFALNAAFIYGAIEAWNNENYTVTAILSLFEVGWYGGNIYNAMNNAHKLNRTREEELKQQRQQKTGFSLGIHNQTPWLQARIQF